MSIAASKMTKIAAKEFPDVLFVRVHKDDMPEMCDALGVKQLPYVQLFKGAEGVVDEFPMNVTAPNLERFRKAARAHRDGNTSEDRAGPASTLAGVGWPGRYTSSHRELRAAMGYARTVRGDGLPPPGRTRELGRSRATEKRKRQASSHAPVVKQVGSVEETGTMPDIDTQRL